MTVPVLLSALPAAQIMVRATEYRRIAETARTADTRDALNRLAVRFAMLAARREIEERSAPRLT